ncbi:MAG: TonB-dependent receptor [Ignavibacteria bacterium]|nr:TonB-dependent receptor [Ignavibacteria bacterium]
MDNTLKIKKNCFYLFISFVLIQRAIIAQTDSKEDVQHLQDVGHLKEIESIANLKGAGNTYLYRIDSLDRLPANNIFQLAELLPSINLHNDGVVIRGQLQKSFLRFNNIDVSDPVMGGTGYTNPTQYPAPSIFAIDNVELVPSDFSCSNFNNIGSTLSFNLKKGDYRKFEFFTNFTGTIPGLYGSTSNDYKVNIENNALKLVETSDGVKYQSSGDRSIDLGIGGPLLLLDSSSFFVSYRNYFRQNNAGLEVYDPANNNLGKLPNQRTYINNFSGSINALVYKGISVELNGMYGISSWENSSWKWLYSTDKGDFNSVTEREAKQSAQNYKISLLNLRIANEITSKLNFKLEFGITNHSYESGRKESFSSPGILSGFDIKKPVDNYNFNDGTMKPGPNGIIDFYESLYTKESFSKDGFMKDFYHQKNPLTGYYEDFNNTTNNNPYSLSSVFIAGGNLPTTIMILNSKNYSAIIEIGYKFSINNITNEIKTGVNYSTFTYNTYYTFMNNIDSNAKIFSQYSYSYIKPLKPYYSGGFIQSNSIYKDISLNFGLRADYFNSNYYTSIDTLLKEPEIKLSPRVNLNYGFDEKNNISIGYGIYYMMPDFNYSLNYILANDISHGLTNNQYLEPTYYSRIQLSYEGSFFGFDLKSAIYQNQYNNTIRKIYYYNSYADGWVSGGPYFNPNFTTIQKIKGQGYGVEFSLSKRFQENFTFFLNYVYSSSVYENISYSFKEEIRSDYNIPHRINCGLNFNLGNNQGFDIFGFYPFENLNLSIISTIHSGTPYTLTDMSGVALSVRNSETLPTIVNFDLRLTKKIYLNKDNNTKMGNLSFAFSIDIFNLFNSAFRIINNYYIKNSLKRKVKDFGSETIYKKGDINIPSSISSTQYDSFGNRLYNPASDFNSDGKITQQEKYMAYRRYLEDYIRQQGDMSQLRSAFFILTIGF